MQAVDMQLTRRGKAARVLFRISAVLLAAVLVFATGYLVAGDVSFLSREAVVAAGSVGAVLIALQMLAQLALLARAEHTEANASASMRELDARHEQLRLVSRLTEDLSRECGPRSVAATATEFVIEEMGAACAAYWELDGDNLPARMLMRGRAGHDENGRTPRRDGAILASGAVRAEEPMVVGAESGQLLALSEALPGGALTLFVPVRGSAGCQGVLEIEIDSGAWGDRQWDLIPTLGRQVGIAFERSRVYAEMQRRADLDFVSGAYNHRFVQTYLQNVITAMRRRGRSAAVVFMDIDNFKAFNDSLGHSVGDRVLQTVANQLRLMTDRVGIVGRSGGDEFMVVLPSHDAAQTIAFIEAFQDWLSVSAPPVSGMFRIQVSCGYAVFPRDAESGQELLMAADARLYRAKTQRGRRDAHNGSGNGPGERTLGVYGLLDRILDGIHQKDNYTRIHCEKTSEYAAALAQVLGLSASAQRSLRLAALLHDVGKVGVPEHILCKPGPLSADERDVVQHQLKVATQLIVDVPNADEVRSVVRHHRERWDGAGYPDRLAGDAIPYLSRVLAVADAYAAITLDRPYRAAMSPEAAYQELKRVSGTQLDPELVKAFGAIVRAQRPDFAGAEAV